MRKKNKNKDSLEEKLHHRLIYSGFERTEIGSSWFARKTNHGLEEVSVYLRHFRDLNFVLSITIQKRLNIVEDIWDKARELVDPPKYQPVTITFYTSIEELSEYKLGYRADNWNKHIDIDDRDSCLDLYNNYEKWLFDYTIPMLNSLEDIHILNKEVNTPFNKMSLYGLLSTGIPLYFRKMIIAKLANDSNYEILSEWVKSDILDRMQKHPQDKDWLDKQLITHTNLYELLKTVNS